MKGKSLIGLILTLLIIAGCVYTSIEGIGPDKSGSAKEISLGLDLAGGVSITYEAAEGEEVTNQKMNDAVYKIQKRVDNYSTEAEVYKEGNDRINVDIPGVSDANAILQELGKPGALEFVDEEDNIIITGKDVESAEAIAGDYSGDGFIEYIVELELNNEGKEKFAEGTRNNIGKIIRIEYDKEAISAPSVKQAITQGTAIITGMANMEEARELASAIRIGALPIELEELRSNTVGAKLGQDAIDTSLLAGAIGLALVLLFMISFYKIPGLAASIALVLYASLMVILLDVFNITLTLPGIAGIILSIGMAVDANIIIFSRIKEELAQDKTLRSSIKSGFRKATSAILDGNITTLIAAAVLFWKGTGPIKGFSQTLALGIIISMITALFITRLILTLFMQIGLKGKKLYGVQKQTKAFDFVTNRKFWFTGSAIIIIIGLAFLPINQARIDDILNYDIEFSGGTLTVIDFDEEITLDEVERNIKPIVTEATGDRSPQAQVVTGKNQVVLKTQTLDINQRTALEDVLFEEFDIEKDSISSESISATISNEMKQDAIIAVVIAAICMLIYITIRFRDYTFGASAVLALIHDIFIVLTIYTVFKIPVNNSFIAAMLTIVGYSINDTIVLFDRIRENKETMNKGEFNRLINTSISQTITRSVNTSLTTFFMIVVLLVVGYGVATLRDFALPLMIGILSGTYSSIFIASPIWYTFKKKEAKS
ncbi:MAG: protein translocase subunit SecD [Eubacteriales bacterium]